MQKPPKDLPRDSVKWARWYEDISDATEERINVIAGDSHSSGSQFRSRSDILAGQIAGVGNVSTQFTFSVPPFTRSTGTGSGNQVYLISPQYTFVPPKPVGKYGVLVIATINCTDTADLSFSPAYVKVNGYVTRSQSGTDNRAPGSPSNFSMLTSVAAATDVNNGAPVNVEFAISGTDFVAHNATFAGCSITIVFTGSL